MKTIAEQWEAFNLRVLSPNAPAIQRTEMRRAFYSGFFCALMSGIEIVNEVGDGSDDMGADMMDKLHSECQAFAADVQEGLA